MDKKYIQIFWDTHIFSPTSTGVYAKEPNIASLFSANVILHLTTATPLWLADSNLIGVCEKRDDARRICFDLEWLQSAVDLRFWKGVLYVFYLRAGYCAYWTPDNTSSW